MIQIQSKDILTILFIFITTPHSFLIRNEHANKNWKLKMKSRTKVTAYSFTTQSLH